MRIRVYSQGNSFVCLLLGIFPFLCSCGKNYTGRLAEQPEVASVTSASGTSVTQNEEHNALQAALQALQKNPASINTLRVAVNGQQVSLLTAAVMLGEDSAMIESLLTQGADIKEADQEGNGILHALVGNRHLSDEQKARIVGRCFDLVDAGEDIRTNNTVLQRLPWSEPRSEPLTPWVKALRRGEIQTASTIVDRMPDQEAARNGIYHAVRRGVGVERTHGVGNRNMIRSLLDKAERGGLQDHPNWEISEQYLRERISEEGILHHVRGFIQESNINFYEYMDLWEQAWQEDGDVETVLFIIQRILRQVPNSADRLAGMAASANRALERYRPRWGNTWEAGGSSEWRRIKAAFIDIGVPADLLDD